MGVGPFQTWFKFRQSPGAGSHGCLQGAWWSVGNALENLVFSIKALSTGAGANWLCLLVVSAEKPKILSYPVNQYFKQIHIVVAR